VEQELIEEGMPAEEVRRLCDVHLAVFRESLEKPKIEVPSGHPIHILRKACIRYFAVRDSARRHLGCVEATQDITDIQKLEGEKRLLEPS